MKAIEGYIYTLANGFTQLAGIRPTEQTILPGRHHMITGIRDY